MVPAGLFDRAGLRAEPGPDVGKKCVLTDEFRALRTAHPAGHSGTAQRLQQRRACRLRFSGVDPEVGMHGGLQHRAKIVDAGDGDRIADARPNEVRERRCRRNHPRDKMSARGVTCQEKRTFDHRGHQFDGGGNLARDVRDANGRAKRVGRHGHRIAAFDGPAREVRPEALVEGAPEPAMNKDHQAPGPAFGAEKIKPVSRPLAIADVERCATALLEFIAIDLSWLHPCRRPALATRDVGAVRIGVVTVGTLLEDHAYRLPFSRDYIACFRTRLDFAMLRPWSSRSRLQLSKLSNMSSASTRTALRAASLGRIPSRILLSISTNCAWDAFKNRERWR